MENQVYGIITMLICLFGYYQAIRQFRQHRIIFSIVLLVACGFILRIYSAADFFLHIWDERYHALVAKNLMNHPLKPTLYDTPLLPYDFKNWTSNHIWLHKQPFPLWTMALSMSLFGVNEIALRLPSIILTTLGIWVTYSTGKHLFNHRVGFIAAFLYSIHGLIIETTAGRVATDHIDVFFLFFIQLSILFAIKFVQQNRVIYNILCGISLGLAILSKWLPAIIVLPVWMLLVLDSKKFTLKETLIHITLLNVVALALFLPWQIHIHHSFPQEAQWESSYNIKHLTKVIEQQGGPIYYYFTKARILYGEIIYLPLIWFLWYSLKKRNNYKRLALLIWFIVPFLFFSFVNTKMQGYILFTAPAVFIITGVFWHYLYQLRHKFRIKWVTYAILVLLLALPVRYAIERIKPFEKTERNPQWAQDLRSLNKKIDEETKVIVFNTERPVETMFYVNCIAYSNIPDFETIRKIIDSGYTVIINDNEKLDTKFRQLNEVEFIKLTGY